MSRSLSSASILLSLVLGCGTSLTVMQPIRLPANSGVRFAVVSCEIDDARTPPDMCRTLRDRVRYGLLARGLLQQEESQPARQVALRITYFRKLGRLTRGLFGPLVGKDGMSVGITVTEGQPPVHVGSAMVENFNYSALNFTPPMMLGESAAKVVAFLRDGAR